MNSRTGSPLSAPKAKMKLEPSDYDTVLEVSPDKRYIRVLLFCLRIYIYFKLKFLIFVYFFPEWDYFLCFLKYFGGSMDD